MNRAFFTTLALLGTLSLRLWVVPAAEQKTDKEEVIADYVYLITLNVIPLAAAGSQSLPKLTVADFKVIDQGRPVRISYFSGPNGQNEPVVLWLVMNCRAFPKLPADRRVWNKTCKGCPGNTKWELPTAGATAKVTSILSRHPWCFWNRT